MAKLVNARWDRMSKAELIRTVKTLRKRKTALLNEQTKLKHELALKVDELRLRAVSKISSAKTLPAQSPPKLPWELD